MAAISRAVRDEAAKGRSEPVHLGALDGVYGADKVWAALNREGIRLPLTVERLMRKWASPEHAVEGPTKSPRAPTTSASAR